MSSSYQLERERIVTCIQDISNDTEFWNVAKQVYTFQSKYNAVFKKFVDLLWQYKTRLPYLFLPVAQFKFDLIKTGFWKAETIFLSSGTTGQKQSHHYVRSLGHYHLNSKYIFQNNFGDLSQYCFLCLLPSYLEREHSSLVEMCRYFISVSNCNESDFFLNDHEKLYETILRLEERSIPTVLIGVSYALMDFAEQYKFERLNAVKVMKTGGMKGRREELHPDQLDKLLENKLGVSRIYAEYGMTECMSQLYGDETGYAQNNRIKVKITDLSDPLTVLGQNRTGRINIIDLGNIDTCSFISTDDVGYVDEKDRLHILGRIDHSDIRGCNLLL